MREWANATRSYDWSSSTVGWTAMKSINVNVQEKVTYRKTLQFNKGCKPKVVLTKIHVETMSWYA